MISARFRAAAAIIAISCCVELSVARSQGQRPISVSFTRAELQPGDVARVDVSGVNEQEKLSATVLGQNLRFHYDPRERQWGALIGIDLETAPGVYLVRFRHQGIESTRTIRIVPKQFRVRRLNVPGGFVDPSAEALEQIKQDNARLAEAYARISPKQWKDAFLLPVDGTPSSNFGTRSYYNGQRRSPHAGVDFSGATGTPVRAANHGEVVVAAAMYLTGNTIVIDYGDRLFGVFAHLSEMRVREGDVVEPATVIGLVGATGRVTGPHLHWSIRLNGARVDPMSLVAATARATR